MQTFFASYLKRYLIPSLPVCNSQYTGSQVEDREEKAERKASRFLLGPSSRGRTPPAGVRAQASAGTRAVGN